MHASTNSATHYGAHTHTYIAAHHTGTHQPTSAFATDASHSAAHSCTHTATNTATHGAYCALCWVVVGLQCRVHQDIQHQRGQARRWSRMSVQ